MRDLGAKVDLFTYSGLNVYHLAAQGDRVRSMLLLRGMNINERDRKLSTPLHWAAYMGSEKVVEYLLEQP